MLRKLLSGITTICLLLVTVFSTSAWASPIGFSGATEGFLPGIATNSNYGFGGEFAIGAGVGTMSTSQQSLPSISSSSAWNLVSSSYSAASINPFSGTSMVGGAQYPLSNSLSSEASMMSANQLAINTMQLAQQAQLQEQAKLAAAKKAAAAHGVTLKPDTSGIPSPWQLKHFTSCGNPGNTQFQDRIETVDAFEQLCSAAQKQGINIRITSALRTPAQQAAVYQKALAYYKSPQVASKYVSPPGPNGSCTSADCAGLAVDVSPSSQGWIDSVVGCMGPHQQTSIGFTSCASGNSPIVQSQLYGFVIPMSWEPWHMVLGIPIGTPGNTSPGAPVAANCNPPSTYTVPQMIASIFGCRLSQAGIHGAQKATIIAQAEVVSKCESSWNPSAVALGGRYMYTPDPATGMRYTATGVFQFITTSAQAYVPGGFAAATNPVANIQGAATYFLAELHGGNPSHPWTPWACAGANDGFAKSSVLPGYPGGPSSLPAWAYSY